MYHVYITPIQIYRKFHLQKLKIFQIKNSDIFHNSAQNIDCGYSLEPPRWGSSNEYPQSMFLSRDKKNNVNPSFTIYKRTMMVLYRSPEQTDLHTYISVEVSAKFTALNFIALHPPQLPCFFLFNASWQLNLERGSPKEHFCQVILKLVQWFLTKRFLKCFILL